MSYLFVLNLEQGGRNPSPLYSVLQDPGALRGPVLNNNSFPAPFEIQCHFVVFQKNFASFVSFIYFEFR
jgi:hypothetical protein